MMERRRFLLFLTLGPGLFAACTASRSPSLPLALDEMLWWLPADTETIVVGQDPPLERPEPEPEDVSLTSEALQISPGMIHWIQDGHLANGLRGLKPTWALQGSRRHRSPRGLGPCTFEGCQILRFEPSSDGVLKSAIQETSKLTAERVQIAGRSVAVFRRKAEETNWTFYLTHPRPGILLVATDRAYLEEILGRMDRRAWGRALPESLPEWQQVDVGARVWAVRHYRQDSAFEDTTSPLHRDGITGTASDPLARGFTFSYGSDSVVKIRYFSGAKNLLQLHKVRLGIVTSHTAEIRLIAPGVVGASIQSSQISSESSFVFELLHDLGYCMAL